MPERQIPVRVQTSSDRAKQRRQYQELMRAGTIESAVIIAKKKGGGGYHVLSQGMDLDAIADSLMAAAHGVAEAAQRESELRLNPMPGLPRQPAPAETRAFRRESIVKESPDGTLQAPPGEAFVFCGECGHTHWFQLVHDQEGHATRSVCTRCGNELAMLHTTHRGGAA